MDELVEQLQLHGRQPARRLAEATGRNGKLVMRYLAQMVDEGVVVYDAVPEMRMVRLRYWCWRRSVVRYYRLPIRTAQRDPWLERWAR